MVIDIILIMMAMVMMLDADVADDGA